MVKNLPEIQFWLRYLGREDTLEKGMATHSSILVWKITWTEEPAGLKELEMTEWFTVSCVDGCSGR